MSSLAAFIIDESMKSSGTSRREISDRLFNHICDCAHILSQFPIHPFHELIECLVALINAMKIAVFDRYVVINAKNCYNVFADPIIIQLLNRCGIFVEVVVMLNKDPERGVYTRVRLYSSPLLNPFHITADALQILEKEEMFDEQMNLFQDEGDLCLLLDEQEDDFINEQENDFDPEDPQWIENASLLAIKV